MTQPGINLTEMFRWTRVPFMAEMKALLTAHWRNIEALTAANKVALEGTQAVVRRNFEIAHQTMAGLSESVRAMVNLKCPREMAERQTELAIAAYETTTANFRELGEIILHAKIEALEVLNRRFTEALQEAKSPTSCSARDFRVTESKTLPSGNHTD
jgi:phasin family protein